MDAKSCCITGHRDIKSDKIASVKQQINEAVKQAVDEGYTYFISGFAQGADLYFAKNVVELKTEHNLILEAAIPHRGRMDSKNHDFQRLIEECNVVRVMTEKYNFSCYMIRNRFMVDASKLVIAVYDGRTSGGTYKTLKYAEETGKLVKIIDVS